MSHCLLQGGRGPLHIGAMYGDEAIVKYMHKRGADVNRQKDEDRRTPLHMAAMFGTSKIVELLIAKGATVDARAEVSQTARNGRNSEYRDELCASLQR